SSSASEATRYRLLWIRELALPQLPDRISDAWLVLADRTGWADALCATLAERGARTTCIYCRPARNGGGHMAPDDGPALHAAIEKAGPLRGIIHLWGLEAPPAAELDAVGLMKAQRYTVASALNLAHALSNIERPPRLWLMTQAAVAAAPEDRLEGVAAAPLWGFGRCLALELPSVWGGLIDLPTGKPTPHHAMSICAALYHSGP